MKKIFITLLFVFMFSLIISPVLAETEKRPSDNTVSNIKEKVQTVLERRAESIASKTAELEKKKEENKSRVRVSIQARVIAYDKLASRSGQLLDKLQIRIDKAKIAGENTIEMEKQMTDARAKLADAKIKLDSVRGLIGRDLDKNGFKEAQKSLQLVHKDLNIVKQDAARIIKNLKSFNSEKESTKSAEKRSTTSAIRSASERE